MTSPIGNSEIPKPATLRDENYLEYVRSLKCLVLNCNNKAEAHHTGRHGIGIKSDDYRAVPLCRKHHTELTAPGKGRRWFEDYYGIDFQEQVIRCLIGYVLRTTVAYLTNPNAKVEVPYRPYLFRKRGGQ